MNLYKSVARAIRLELAMNDLESVRDSIIFSFKRAETCQDRVINAFYEHHSIKGVKVLLLKVLIPLLDFNWNSCKIA